MTDRMTRESDYTRYQGILTNAAVAAKGELACLNTATGLLAVGATGTTLPPIGYFTENLTGDGTTTTVVQLFHEIKLHWWENDATTPVDAADIGSDCYIKNGTTVSADSTGRSVAGKVWGLNSLYGVLVSMKIPAF